MKKVHTDLKELLIHEIFEQVPLIFSGDDPLTPPQDNLLSQFADRLQLLFSKDTNIEAFFKDLKEQGGGTTVCGRVFDKGDYFYTCVECRTDPTCVFCKDCFFNSSHVDHNYKMFASGGAGCCDCGDSEAWTKDPHCNKHKPQAEVGSSDPLGSLPEWLALHGHQFCHFIFEYALIFQNYKDWESLPPHFKRQLEPFLRPDSYCVLVMNDEVNSFNGVVALFTKELGVINRDSLSMTYAIDKVGRALVSRGSLEECSKVAASLSILSTAVVPTIIAQHQQCSVFLLSTLLNICTQTPGLQKLCAMTLFGTDFINTNANTLAEYLFSIYPNLWVCACEAWMSVFLQAVIPQEDMKRIFADIFLKNYEDVVRQHIENDNKEHCSLHFLTVQLFTSPSLSLFLIERSSALLEVSSILENALSDKGRVTAPITSSSIKSFLQKTTIHIYNIAHDLGYLVRHPPSALALNEPVRNAFLDGLKAYIKVLMLFEDSDPVKRMLGVHIQIEVDWKEMFLFQRIFQPITRGFINWLSQNKDLLLQAVAEVFEVLKKLHSPDKMKCVNEKVFSIYDCKTPVGTVSKDTVSCHIPLTRFLSGLLSACHSKEINIERDTFLQEGNAMSWLFERCIQPLVFKSQVLNNLWVRNGSSVIQMITNYHSYMCNEMYYRDVYLLQLLAAHMSPEYVLLNLINKFEVTPWFESDYSHSKKTRDESDKNLFIESMCEEMLGTLITIIIERNNVNLAELTPDQVMEQHLLNILFLKEWSHGNLMDAVRRGNSDSDDSLPNSFVSILPKLAKESFVSGKKLFTLKPEYYDRVCVFFYHDSKENQPDANNQLKTLSQGNSKVLSTLLTPPIMPNFRPHLCPILNIFQQNLFLHILYTILDRTRKESELVSDYMVHQALFLIAVGLQEEKNGNISQFAQSLKGNNKLHSSNYDFLPILAKLSSIPSCEDIRPLIEWINSVLLPNEMINIIHREIDKRNITDKKMVEQGLLHQTRAMENLKNKQASFLEKFGMSDDEDSDNGMDEVVIASKVPIKNGGIGVQCLNMLPGQQAIGCIFCQESTTIQLLPETGKFWILPGYCTPYSGLRKEKSSIRSLCDTDVILTPATLDIGVISKSCGHSFHFNCWEQFLTSSSTNHSHLVTSAEEFKCPLCYSTCNTIFPLSLSLRYNAEVSASHKPPAFEQFLHLLSLINNVMFHGEEAVKLATAFCDCFQMQQDRHNSIRFFKEHQNAFKLASKCTEVGFVGAADLTDPALSVLALNNTVNYTLQAKNNELAALEKLVSNELSAHQQLVLRSIVHTAVVSKSVESHQVCCQNANRILDRLLMSASSLDSKTFDCDVFSLLVNLQLSLPSLIAEVKNPIPDLDLSLALLPTVSPYVFKLTLYYRLVQILLYINLSTVSTDYEPDGVNRDSLFKLWSLRRRTLPADLRQTDISMKTLHSEVMRLLLPFLRTASMFYNLLLNLPFPTQLIDWDEQSGSLPLHEEVDILLSHVGCPGLMGSISEIFSISTLEDLVRTWFSVSLTSSLVYAQYVQHPSQIVFPYGGLVALPDKYTDILGEASEYNCPITTLRAEEVVKCLICGNCVCISCFACTETFKQTSNPAQPIGPYTEHMLKCSNGVGVGIWVKNACIVLLSVASRAPGGLIRLIGTIRPIPYLDQHGEHDKQLRKGTPLFLNKQGYKEINLIWMQNDIPRNIEKSNEDKPHFQIIDWYSF